MVFSFISAAIDIEKDVIVGIECLARLNHPVLGNIPPAQFIPILEDNRLINSFTEMLVETALNQLSTLLRIKDLTLFL